MMNPSTSTAYRIDQLDLVMFDLDGTIRHNDPPGLDTFYALLSEKGWLVSEADRRAAERWNLAYWASSEALKQDVEAAGEDRQQLWAKYNDRHLQQLGMDDESRRSLGPEIVAAMETHYEPTDLVPDDVVPTISWLRQAGVKVGLVSNRREPMGDLLDRLGLLPLFDYILAAGEIDTWKPDPYIFEYAMERLGARPDRTVYIGDNPWADVDGAAAAGCLPVLIDPQGLFPEIEVPVVRSIGDLRPLLNGG